MATRQQGLVDGVEPEVLVGGGHEGEGSLDQEGGGVNEKRGGEQREKGGVQEMAGNGNKEKGGAMDNRKGEEEELHTQSLILPYKITTLNVRSIKSMVRAQSILSFLSAINADIFLLQECSLPFFKSYKKWENLWAHGPSIRSGSNENKADGVLCKNPHIEVKGSTVVRPGRVLLTHLTFLDRDFKVLNVYGFNDKDKRYNLLEDLQVHMLGRVPLMVGGDFNCVLSKTDRKGGGEDFKIDKTSFLLQGIVKDFKMIDCFRAIPPREDGFTWTTLCFHAP
ncbi:uncharacterized protein LOC114779014 [Denticeps clupeoides]|uniref:uncharacterized protein LOC114779014 n=1 Tax=Denticeps clupeoides TaxID=299321 RepID=UPI0010A31420|nr:uncharacterized protein LOC114779014 [Denticeps clupeoides]